MSGECTVLEGESGGVTQTRGARILGKEEGPYLEENGPTL